MHLYGMGLPQSSSEAVKLFSNAAEQGNLEARFNLGALYVVGDHLLSDVRIPRELICVVLFLCRRADKELARIM